MVALDQENNKCAICFTCAYFLNKNETQISQLKQQAEALFKCHMYWFCLFLLCCSELQHAYLRAISTHTTAKAQQCCFPPETLDFFDAVREGWRWRRLIPLLFVNHCKWYS